MFSLFQLCCVFIALFARVFITTVSAAKRWQILTVETVSQGVYKNSSDPEEERTVEQLDEGEQDRQ